MNTVENFIIIGPESSEMQSIKLENEPVFSLYQANSKSIEEVLNNSLGSSHDEDLDEDDCVLLGTNVPHPLISTSEGLVKHQDDAISFFHFYLGYPLTKRDCIFRLL